MRRLRTAAALLAVVGLTAPLTGCFELGIVHNSIFVVFLRLFGNPPSKSPGKAKSQKLKLEVPVTISGTIGGLTGTYSLTAGTYGTFAGTADIKGTKKAKIRSEDDAVVMTLVENVVLDVHGVDIAVTEANAKFNGKQTTGGVKKKFNYKIKFEGTIASGEGAGNRVKGTIKTKGKFE